MKKSYSLAITFVFALLIGDGGSSLSLANDEKANINEGDTFTKGVFHMKDDFSNSRLEDYIIFFYRHDSSQGVPLSTVYTPAEPVRGKQNFKTSVVPRNSSDICPHGYVEHETFYSDKQ
jgi:hypothetical protein